MKLLTWMFRQKSRRPTKKSAKIGADVGRQSVDVANFLIFFLADSRPTVGLGNVTVVLLYNTGHGVFVSQLIR